MESYKPGDVIKFTRGDMMGYRGRCFGKHAVTADHVDVRILETGSVLYHGQPKHVCDEYVIKDAPMWLGLYENAAQYSGPSGDVSPIRTTKELVLFDILSERNLSKLLDFHKGDPAKCETISRVTGYQLDYDGIELYGKAYMTKDGSEQLDRVDMEDACGFRYVAGKAGIDRSSEDAETDMIALLAIKEFCEELGMVVHGWHQSETPRLRDGGMMSAEVALWNARGCVETACDNTDRMMFEKFVARTMDDLKEDNMPSQTLAQHVCDAFEYVREKMPHMQLLALQTSAMSSTKPGHVVIVFVNTDRCFELDTDGQLRAEDIRLESVACAITSYEDAIYPTLMSSTRAKKFVETLQQLNQRPGDNWERYINAVDLMCGHEYLFDFVRDDLITAEFDYTINACGNIRHGEAQDGGDATGIDERDVRLWLPEEIDPYEVAGNSTAPWEPTATVKTAHVLVLGMGCTQGDAEVLRRDLNDDLTIGTDLAVLCNPAMGHTLGGIFKACAMNMPKGQSEFVRRVYDKVRGELTTHDRVVLTGLSYGGMTVSLVAKLLDDTEKSRVDVATYGSIHVPPTPPGVRMVHYIFLDDVSLRCNRQRAPHMDGAMVKRVGDVVWIDPYRMLNRSKMGRWEIHNAYWDVIAAVVRTNDVGGFDVPSEGGSGMHRRGYLADVALACIVVAAAFWR